MEKILEKGIYSSNRLDTGSSGEYFLIVKSFQEDYYLIYVFRTANQMNNNKLIQTFLNFRIEHDHVDLKLFKMTNSKQLFKFIDGYLGQCDTDLCEKLYKLYPNRIL